MGCAKSVFLFSVLLIFSVSLMGSVFAVEGDGCEYDEFGNVIYCPENTTTCTTNADCLGQYCRTSDGVCVQCLTDSHCSGENNVCENYQCKLYPWVSWQNLGTPATISLTNELLFKKNYVYPAGIFDSYVEYCCFNNVVNSIDDQAYWDCVNKFKNNEPAQIDFFGNHASRDNLLSQCLAKGYTLKDECTGFTSFSDGRRANFDQCFSTFVSCMGSGCSGYDLDKCSITSGCSPAYSPSGKYTYFIDVDSDGKGNPFYSSWRTSVGTEYRRTDFSDCNDNNASIYFGANEICGDGVDNNCNGLIDEGCEVTNPCLPAMDWLTLPHPQVGDKSCKNAETISTCTSTGVVETTCGMDETCQDINGLNATCVPKSISQCGSCETGSCGSDLSCRTTLGGQKICVPTGTCAIAVGSPECTHTSTSTCVGTTKYTCTPSTGVWNSGTANSEDCGYNPENPYSFTAYWGNFTDTGRILNEIYVGQTIYRFFKDTNEMFTGQVELSGAGGSATLQMTNGALISNLFNSSQNGTYSFTALAATQSIPSNQLIIKRSVCGNGDIEPGEVCDNRTSNGVPCSAPYGGSCVYCSSNCQQIITVTGMYCGDGSCNPEFGEDCSCSDCASLPSCQVTEEGFCGDGNVSNTEQCDAGTNNGVICSAPRGGTCTYCSSTCTNLIVYGTNCSDGIQNGNELGIDCEDNDLCTGEKEFCSAEESDPSICSDYSTQETCEDYNQSVADASVVLGSNQKAECEWTGSTCQGKVINTAPDGTKIGSCSYIQNQNQDTCDDGFLTYSWNGSWTWDANNNYLASSSIPFCDEGYIYGSDSMCHYDPLGSWASCKNGQRIIPCPAQVQLNYFTWKNIVAAIFLIIAIYLIINSLRNLKKESVQEIKKEKTIAKKKPAKNKSPAKKTTKKKVVKKRK